MKKSDLKGLKLKFGYCGCGCHGHYASAGPIAYWIYISFEKKRESISLYRGHGFSDLKLGEFDTFSRAVNKANHEMRVEVRKMLEKLGA